MFHVFLPTRNGSKRHAKLRKIYERKINVSGWIRKWSGGSRSASGNRPCTRQECTAPCLLVVPFYCAYFVQAQTRAIGFDQVVSEYWVGAPANQTTKTFSRAPFQQKLFSGTPAGVNFFLVQKKHAFHNRWTPSRYRGNVQESIYFLLAWASGRYQQL